MSIENLKNVLDTPNILKFKGEDGTVFTRGPFKFDGKEYEWKLEDRCGIDYCTEQQLKWWRVKCSEVLEFK